MGQGVVCVDIELPNTDIHGTGCKWPTLIRTLAYAHFTLTQIWTRHNCHKQLPSQYHPPVPDITLLQAQPQMCYVSMKLEWLQIIGIGKCRSVTTQSNQVMVSRHSKSHSNQFPFLRRIFSWNQFIQRPSDFGIIMNELPIITGKTQTGPDICLSLGLRPVPNCSNFPRVGLYAFFGNNMT